MGTTSEKVTFEQALGELETVVRELESSDIGLDESLIRYERGVKLIRICRELLDGAERRIRLLTAVDAEGNPVLEAFDATATADRAAAACEPPAASARNANRASRRAGAAAEPDGELLF